MSATRGEVLLDHVELRADRADALMLGENGRKRVPPTTLELREKLFERRPHVGDDPDRRRNAATELAGLDVDLDVRRLGGRNRARSPVRLHLLEPCPEPYDDVRFGEEALRQAVAVGAEPAGREWMVVGDRAATGEARQHRDREVLGELAELGKGAGGDGAAARNQERTLGVEEEIGGRCDQPGVGGGPLRRARGHVPCRGDVGIEQVARDVDQHRPRPPATCDPECLADGVGDLLGAVDPYRPLGHRSEDAVGIDLLGRAPMRVEGGASPGDRNDRQRSDVGLGNTREEVRAARACGHEADPGLARQLRVRGRHARRRLLVSNEDVLDLGRVIERVVDGEDVAARQAEDEAHAFRTQDVDNRTTRLHRLHLPTLLRSPAWSAE